MKSPDTLPGKIFAVTHGKKHPGSNPALTKEGREEVHAAAKKIKPEVITGFMCGTGLRFQNTWLAVVDALDLSHLDLRHSPLLGSADSGIKAESGSHGWDIHLADGRTIKDTNYVGLIGTPGVDLWKFLEGNVTSCTMLCTGREFIGALIEGGADAAKSGTLYEIDCAARTVHEVK